VRKMETVTNGAALIGLINILGILVPNIDTRVRVVLVILIGAISAYIPLTHPIVQGIKFALGTSGIYKVSQIVGGK